MKEAVTTTTMKTNTTLKPGPPSSALFTLLLGATTIWAMPATARGQIFVTNENSGTIGEYTTTGAKVNASLISGLGDPEGIAVSGGNLFVANYGGTTRNVGEYTTTGATVNASLFSGFHAFSIAVS